jgi:Domain of unknown function (DUF4291)
MNASQRNLELEPYAAQLPHWPADGRHILAQFDDESVVVYQAYRPDIARYAIEHGTFGGPFSWSRMTWIKPNFLWMMYRSGWGTKEGQEVTLAIRLRRTGFDTILTQAVSSSFSPARFSSDEAWRAAVATSDVRLQWDPDHDPSGAPVMRRAIQLGLRGDTLRRFAGEWVVSIHDLSTFVSSQRGRSRGELVLPRERVYPMPAELDEGGGNLGPHP